MHKTPEPPPAPRPTTAELEPEEPDATASGSAAQVDLRLLSDALATEIVCMAVGEKSFGFFLWGMEDELYEGPTLLDAWETFLAHHHIDALRIAVARAVKRGRITPVAAPPHQEGR